MFELKRVLTVLLFAVFITITSVLSQGAFAQTATTTTATTISSSLNPSNYGQPVTFTATISPTVPDGETVAFANGTAILGTNSTIGGVATFTTSALSAGSNQIVAGYSGDANFTASNSSPVTQTVNQVSTTTATTISSSLNPSNYGQPVTFTATISPAVPDGETVTFLDGATALGANSTTGSVATFTMTALSAGSHQITASYSGDANFASSNSNVLSQTVNQVSVATTAYISSSLDPSNSGDSVTFSATVSSSVGSIPDGETVTFLDGSTTLGTGNTAGGVATFTTSALSVGNHQITASYAGDANFLASNSSPVAQTVNQIATTTLLYSSQNPSTLNQKITFSATVSPATGSIPDGETVTFLDGSTILGTNSTIGGVATFTTSALSAGVHNISAKYSGDANYATSTSWTWGQSVSPINFVTVTSSLNPSVYGQAVALTANVASSTATGTVQFVVDGTNLGYAVLVSGGTGVLETSSLPVGSHTIVASYSGDATNPASMSTGVSQTVNNNPNQLIGSATSCNGVFSCTFTITSSSGTGSASLTGGLTFRLPGESKSSTVPYSVTGYPQVPGGWHVTGIFTGVDTNTGKIITGSTDYMVGAKGHSGRGGGITYYLISGKITFVPTNQDPTSTTVTCTPSTVQPGKTSVCTITVTDSTNASNIPTGLVSISSSSAIGTLSSSYCPLSSGSCSVQFKASSENGGSTKIAVTYNSDSSHYVSLGSTVLSSTLPPGN